MNVFTMPAGILSEECFLVQPVVVFMCLNLFLPVSFGQGGNEHVLDGGDGGAAAFMAFSQSKTNRWDLLKLAADKGHNYSKLKLAFNVVTYPEAVDWRQYGISRTNILDYLRSACLDEPRNCASCGQLYLELGDTNAAVQAFSIGTSNAVWDCFYEAAKLEFALIDSGRSDARTNCYLLASIASRLCGIRSTTVEDTYVIRKKVSGEFSEKDIKQIWCKSDKVIQEIFTYERHLGGLIEYPRDVWEMRRDRIFFRESSYREEWIGARDQELYDLMEPSMLGDSNSSYKLSLHFLNALSCEPSYIYWMRISAEQGSTEACGHLGDLICQRILREGLFDDLDKPRPELRPKSLLEIPELDAAQELYRRSCLGTNANHRTLEYANFHINGMWNKPDPREGARLLLAACSNNLQEAWLDLASHIIDENVPTSHKLEAYFWISLAFLCACPDSDIQRYAQKLRLKIGEMLTYSERLTQSREVDKALISYRKKSSRYRLSKECDEGSEEKWAELLRLNNRKEMDYRKSDFFLDP